MHTFNINTTIRREGELHLEDLPFHIGEKVKVIVIAPNAEDEDGTRKSEYEAFMKAYPEEDSIYNSL